MASKQRDNDEAANTQSIVANSEGVGTQPSTSATRATPPYVEHEAASSEMDDDDEAVADDEAEPELLLCGFGS